MLSFESLEECVAEFAWICSVWFLLLFSFSPREMLAFVSFLSVARQKVIVAWKSWETIAYILLWFTVVILQEHLVGNLSNITHFAQKYGLVLGWQREKQFFFFIPGEQVLKHLGTICLFRSKLFRPPTRPGQWLSQVAAWGIKSPGALQAAFTISSCVEVRDGVQVQD